MSPQEVSARTGIPVDVLTRWRRTGKGPKWKKLGDLHTSPIRYSEVDIVRWLAEQAEATAEPTEARLEATEAEPTEVETEQREAEAEDEPEPAEAEAEVKVPRLVAEWQQNHPVQKASPQPILPPPLPPPPPPPLPPPPLSPHEVLLQRISVLEHVVGIPQPMVATKIPTQPWSVGPPPSPAALRVLQLRAELRAAIDDEQREMNAKQRSTQNES